MMLHPAHAMLIADTRHRELVAEAEEFRAAERAAAAGVAAECRVPTGRRAEPCRPDPRQAAGRVAARRYYGYIFRGHRAPR